VKQLGQRLWPHGFVSQRKSGCGKYIQGEVVIAEVEQGFGIRVHSMVGDREGERCRICGMKSAGCTELGPGKYGVSLEVRCQGICAEETEVRSFRV
jgi:hypothetical protein